jgi:branched-chain amino acid transport system ATP-binding protein
VIAAVRETGIATIVVDKTVAAILSMVGRSAVLIKGSVVYDGDPAVLPVDPELMQRCQGL